MTAQRLTTRWYDCREIVRDHSVENFHDNSSNDGAEVVILWMLFVPRVVCAVTAMVDAVYACVSWQLTRLPCQNGSSPKSELCRVGEYQVCGHVDLYFEPVLAVLATDLASSELRIYIHILLKRYTYIYSSKYICQRKTSESVSTSRLSHNNIMPI
jgi:hypothetical protein